MRRLMTSHLIGIFTVCKGLSEFISCPKLPDSTLHVKINRSSALEAVSNKLLGVWLQPVIHNQGPVYLHDLLNFKNQSYSFRYTRTAEIPKVRTSSYGLSSFRYSAAKLWNSLPQHFRDEVSLRNFKSLIGAWDGESCACTFCSAN